MINVITIGDPHIKIDNLEIIDQYIEKIESTVDRINPDLVVVLGDVLHSHERIHTTAMNYAYEFIHRLAKLCPVYVLVGNHDYINNSQFLTDNHWMNGMKQWNNVVIVDKVITINVNSIPLVLSPYVFPGRFIEALDTLTDVNWKEAKAIFCHQEFKGCKMGAMISTEGDAWNAEWPQIISGHIHDKQWVGENIYYAGSSMQHAFGESHDKTIASCSIQLDGKIEIKEIPTLLPVKKILYMDMDRIQNYVPSKSTDKIRITVKANTQEIKAFRKSSKFKELTASGIKIVFKTPEVNISKSDSSNQEEDCSFVNVLHNLVKTDAELLGLFEYFFNLSDNIS